MHLVETEQLDREDEKKCSGTSAMDLGFRVTSAKLLLMMPNSTPHYIPSVLLKTRIKY
jgi:hypothetical protein